MAHTAGGSNSGSEVPIRIELRSAKGSRQSLDEPLDLTVAITNISNRPIWLVGVLPGSDGFRYPRYTAQIDGPDGPVSLQSPDALDYGPGLQVDHFVQLAPGESFDPQGEGFIPVQQLAWFHPLESGRYRFRLLFDSTVADPREWMGQTYTQHRSQVENLIERVPKVQVWSNQLEIDFD